MGAGAARRGFRRDRARERPCLRGGGGVPPDATLKFRDPHDREIFRLAYPAFLTLIAEPLYLLADTAVVGRLGTEQLAGLAVAATLLVTACSLFVFLAYGTTGSVARLLGAGAHERAAMQGVQAMWLAAGIGVLVGLIGEVASGPLIDAMGAEGDVARYASTYLRISLIGLPAFMLSMAGTGYLRGLQDTRTPLLVTIGANAVNLVLEIVLIFGFDRGIGASALTTVVAQALGAAVFVWMVGRHALGLGVRIRPHLATLRSHLRIGMELFLRTISLRAVLLASTAVAARLGTNELAANQVALELWNFLAFVLDSIAIAGQAIIGRELGAGRAEEARAIGRRMIEWGILSGVVLGAALFLFRGQVAGLFTDDRAVTSLIAHALMFAALFQPAAGIAFVLDGVLIGAGDQRYLALAMLLSALVFVPAAAGVLILDLGLGALWVAIGLFISARAATLMLRFATPRWQVLGVS